MMFTMWIFGCGFSKRKIIFGHKFLFDRCTCSTETDSKKFCGPSARKSFSRKIFGVGPPAPSPPWKPWTRPWIRSWIRPRIRPWLRPWLRPWIRPWIRPQTRPRIIKKFPFDLHSTAQLIFWQLFPWKQTWAFKMKWKSFPGRSWGGLCLFCYST